MIPYSGAYDMMVGNMNGNKLDEEEVEGGIMFDGSEKNLR